MRHFVMGLALVLAAALLADAQIGIPNSFTANTRIVSADVNANFTALGDNALNRTGGTMTGTLTTRDVLPDGNNTRDFGATGTRFRDGWFGRNVAITGTLGVGDTSAAALDVAGGITAGTGNVAIIAADGRIPALSSTYIVDLSGANLTGLLETAVADGSVFPRLAANETITGTYTIANTASGIWFDETDGAADNQLWRVVANTESFFLEAYNDALTLSSQPIAVTRTGTVIDSIALTATSTTVSGTLGVTGATTVGSLGVGGGTAIASVVTNSVTWNPPSLAIGASTTTSVSGLTGAIETTPCIAAGHTELSTVTGVTLSATYAGVSGQVRIVLFNGGAFVADVPSITVRVTCFVY